MHQHGKMCTTGAEAKASRQQVQDMISDVTRSVKKCKDKLTVLEDSNEDIVEAAEVGYQAASACINPPACCTGPQCCAARLHLRHI